MYTHGAAGTADFGNRPSRAVVHRPMKAALLVCLLAATALAAPRYPRGARLDPTLSEHVKVAEEAWTAAENEPDPTKQAARWEEAAAAFARVDVAPVDLSVKRAAALAGWLAWKNTIGAPQPQHSAGRFEPLKPRALPAREQHLVEAIDRYARYVTDPADPELPVALFLKAMTAASFDQLEAAIPIYRDILKRFPKHPTAAWSATLALDAYNRLQQFDQLLALANELAANPALLKDRDDLTAQVKMIQRAARRKAAGDLEKRAQESKDLAHYVEAGQAYLDIYNANPDEDGGDEVLYNAGVSFQEGAAMANAIQMYSLIQKRFPRSRLAARALARLGKLYGDIAMYDRAAEMLETYAKKYAGEKDAYAAMSDAVFYRKAIGDRAKAIEDTKYFVKVFTAKRPRDAANAMFSLTALYDETPAQLQKHLREYIKVFCAKGEPGWLVAAHAKLGLLLWKQSCPKPGYGGLCVKAVENAPRVCGKGTTRTLAAVPRDERKVKEAFVELTAAIKELERQRHDDDASARYFYAQAKLAMADLELERSIALALPTNLDFDPSNRTANEASMKRFDSWFSDKVKATAAATRQYEAVLSIKDAASSIDATERLALATQALEATLVATPLPKALRAADKKAAYCNALTTAAEPLHARTIESYGVCLAKSTELAWFSDASARCERELSVLRPDEFPLSTELRAPATYVAPVIAAEPPIRY